MQSTLKKDAGSENGQKKRRGEQLGEHATGRSQSWATWILALRNVGFLLDTRLGKASEPALYRIALWGVRGCYTLVWLRKEVGQTKSPIKTTFLILNVDSVCWQVKQGMKAYPMHSKSGNTLNVTEFVFRRVETQGSIMGRALGWQSGAAELTSSTSCTWTGPEQCQSFGQGSSHRTVVTHGNEM